MYFFLVKKATLGSFSKLPAASCHEIKSSSGGVAPSGRYWIDSGGSGNQPVTAYCDMEKEGKCVSAVSHPQNNLAIFQKKKTCSVFLSSFRNTSGSLREREMLWEHEPIVSISFRKHREEKELNPSFTLIIKM